MKIIWQSTITEDMIEDLTEDEIEQVKKQLDNAVFDICIFYGIR